MTELLKYIIIAIVQGISEVLPISSSAHLLLVEELFLLRDDNLTLEIFLHLASLISVVFFLRKPLISLISGFFKYTFFEQPGYQTEFKLCWYVVFSTIPVVVFTIVFKEQITRVSNNILIIGILLMINGVLLLITNKVQGRKHLKTMTLKDAIIIGLFQCLGIFPGISRSGSCLCGAYTRKLEKNDAKEYAFLLFLPAVIGAFILEIDNFGLIFTSPNIGIYIIAFIITAIVTYLAFLFLDKVIKNGKIKYFGYYCIIVGLLSVLTNLIK